MLVVVFRVDCIPNWKTFVSITFPYSCITETKSDNFSKTLATTSPFLLFKHVRMAGRASEAALGLCFNQRTININARDLTVPLDELM
jgi:hypothetical protein